MENTAASVRDLTESCISKFEELLALKNPKHMESLETRLADFNLWADGVGALAKPGASLDSRLQGRMNDLALVKNILIMLVNSLDYYASLAKTDTRSDGAIQNLDSAIKNLALIGVAIRRTGKASRNRRADQTFNPDEHQELRKHLEWVILVRPAEVETGNRRHVTDLDAPNLSDLQRRLIEANLRRRHKFLRAQRYSRIQEGAQTRSLSPPVPSFANDSPRRGEPVVKQSTPDLHFHGPTPNPSFKGKETATPTISGFSRASTAEGTLQHAPATKGYTPGAAKTQITLIASDSEFPQAPFIPLGRTISKCPCCCQSLPVETFRNPKIWKQHIVEDLCPYTCVAENCPTPQLLFCTQNEWESHVKKSHLPQWQCPFCEQPDEDYPTMESMGSHFQTDHKHELLENPLSSLLSWSAVQRMGIKSCPLCSSCGPEDSPELVDHVLRHAYEFSLRALPWPQPILHDLNAPPGSFSLPEDSERAADLERWIKGAAHESVGTPELTLCDYDGADHSVPAPTNVSEYSDYFLTHSYFDDRPEDKSSRPQGIQSIAFSHLALSEAHEVTSRPAFVLVPINSNAWEAVDHARNSHLRISIEETTGLWVDFANPEIQAYTLGLSESDIYLPGMPTYMPSNKSPPSISAVHASFQVVEDTGAVLLWDLSDDSTVEPLPQNHSYTVQFHTDTNAKSVLVARGINSRVAFGKDQWFVFEIQWQSNGLYRFPKTEPYTMGPTASRSKRYVLGQEVGTGPSGTVWWALDAFNGKMIAVKRFNNRPSFEVANLLTMTLKYSPTRPHVLQILDCVGDNEGDFCGEIFMPLMTGNLRTLVEKIGVPDEDALSDTVLRQMLRALQFLASYEIIHRNIELENILWDHDDAGNYHFYLSDFGLSNNPELGGTVAATKPFMAPEVFQRHVQPQTTKIDIWSLFAVIVWIRDVDFRRKCYQYQPPNLHARLIEISKSGHYAAIRGMANMDPEKRPSATKQLAILDGLDGSSEMTRTK